VLDWIFDRPWLLNAAGRLGAQTPPEKLAGLTLTVIEAEEGSASKELDRLVAFLRDHIKPAVVMLPNLMFVGMARAFRDRLGVPVVCEMTGEDIFLDAMREPDRSRIQRVIRSRSVDVSRFVATSDHYARRMAEYLGINVAEIDVVPTGIATDFFTTDNSAKKTQLAASQSEQAARPPTIGYLARICPEKGLANLLDALAVLRARQGMETVRVQAAGYLGGKDQKWFDALMKRASAMGLARAFEYLGEVDRTQKFAFLDSIDVFSVPTAYPEAKGVYLLEAMARGVPVVQPAMGSFPELIEQTGGGLLVAPNDPAALADGLQRLLQDRAERDRLGAAGRSAVQAGFTEEHMAGNMLKVFRSVL
jgi:glycosyltransferase involved in cell wall biosynthesis